MIEKKPFERLPKDVTPVNYKLRLKPDLLAFTFDGHEIVSLKVNKPTNKIVLNSIDISIKKATLTVGEKTEDAVVSYCMEDETATLGFAESVAAGDAKLCIDFEGELNDKMKGFYHSKYFTPDGEERYGAVTQFESTDARRAFPCWDEPALKATFDVTLVVPEDRVALSNMPVQVEKVLGDGCKEVHYLTTPIMSTYLLAFVVGEYDYVEGRSSDGVLIRVYTPVGKKEQGQFALEVAVKTLPFYKDYFGIGFPLPKSDLIAIADFAAGAMENWGLVTYRETALLIDQKNSSSATKQWVALVVGHELAHQWFGNLVTMEWWTHLWLNEGFASWIEYLCVDYCHPEFDIWTQFVSSDYMRALELDALHNSHPIEVPVGHPDEVDEIFDTISYSKGASVIRMLHEFLGDEFFKKGLNIYLNRFKYSNAFTEDLWAALEESSGQPVGRMMTTWTKQMGFPVVQVSQRQEGSKRIIMLKQEKFNADGSVDETDSSWYVPVSLCTASSPSTPVKKVLLLPEVKSVEVILDNVSAGEWVKVNPGTYGVYRTQYSADMLDTLLPAIKDKTLPPRDRLGLQNDVFALARAGKISSVEFLNVVKSFEQEDNYTVWNDLANNLDQLGKLLQYTDIDDAFRSFVCKLYQPIGEKMGWDPKENESHLDSLLRSLVVQCLAKSGDSKTITEAKKRFHSHCDGSCCLGADIRSPVYHTVLRDADEEVFDRVLKLHKEADLQEEKVRILRSLGSVKHDKLIQRCLQFAMSDEVRSQDTVFVIISATCSKLGRQMAWEFIKENWSELANRYSGGFLLSRLIMSTTYHFASNDMAKEVEGFFVDHPAPAAQRTIQQSCENIRLNATWRQRDESAIREWLAKNST